MGSTVSDFDKESVVDWLHNLTRLGIKLGLKNITELLARIGNPQDSFRTIHVAGSDGKGSTCAYIYSVLMEAGINVGLYSSPQIVDFNERISVNGNNITDDDFLLLAYEVMVVVESMKEEGYDCTFFESTTALAFLYFQRKGVEYAVIEVGMGGRYDATNVISPEVTVITNISREHTQFLGGTISEIASEKAGIIKSGVPVVTCNTGDALKEIARTASLMDSELVVVEDVSLMDMTQTGSVIEYRGKVYEVGIPGSYQATNAAMAIETLSRISLSKDVMPYLAQGLKNAHWPGRMEKIEGLPLIVDVTHTKSGMVALCEDVLRIYGKVTVVFGILSDKDLVGISECIAKMSSQVYVTEPDSDRAMVVSEVARVMGLRTEDVIVSPSVEDAIEAALKDMKGSAVLVTGSFRMAEGAMRWLKKRSARF
ncbi:MAG: bifunctional folylpolyglutamate synthase/dihydrofolate synthase [Thermoplasmata archaeon]|nr:bifunctional folylpolyglutamate synthase/dihydrofolate synthase [Thermoplasmata archaeon]